MRKYYTWLSQKNKLEREAKKRKNGISKTNNASEKDVSKTSNVGSNHQMKIGKEPEKYKERYCAHRIVPEMYVDSSKTKEIEYRKEERLLDFMCLILLGL